MTRYGDTAEPAALSIGAAAAATGLSVKTIRHYEEIGLVPEARRRSGRKPSLRYITLLRDGAHGLLSFRKVFTTPVGHY